MLKIDFTKEELLKMVKEISNYNGKFDEIANASNDLNSFLEMFSDKEELVRAWSYGGAKYEEEYFRIDVCGNIKSLSKDELLEECEENRDVIIEEYVELVQNNQIIDSENFVDDELLEELDFRLIVYKLSEDLE